MPTPKGNSESCPNRGDGVGGRREGDRSPGRGGGGKKTPGGSKPTKLPTCSLANNMTPSFYIGGGNGVALVEAPLLALGWKRTADKYDERFRLKWVECKSRINYSAFREGDQLVNHIANCQLLTNKMGLLNSLQEYERVTLSTKGRLPRLKMAEFVPETYRLDNKDDREMFLQVYKDEEIWISKPTGMNQGKGIFLLRDKEEIEKFLSERDARQQQSRTSRPLMSRIVQRYIHKPLLLEERKFDIRAYMLIASTVPYLVLYHKGYIRLSCQKYDGDDTNLSTHLTNQFIQKKVPNYGEVKEDTAWSMDKFNDYINEKVAPQTGVEQNWVYNTLTKQMQRIMLHCFNSVKHKLDCKVGYFDLYGLDFMVDQDMKIWLIEININPCLATNCSALKEVIPDIVQESIYLSLECFEKSRKNQALTPLSSLKSFTVLHCGSNPNAVAPRQTRSVSPAKDSSNGAKSTHSPPAQRRGRSPLRTVPRVSIATTPLTQSPYQTRKSEFSTIVNPQGPAGNKSSARVTRTATTLEVKTVSLGDKSAKPNSTNKNNSASGGKNPDTKSSATKASSDMSKPKPNETVSKTSNVPSKTSADKSKSSAEKLSHNGKNSKSESSVARKDSVNKSDKKSTQPNTESSEKSSNSDGESKSNTESKPNTESSEKSSNSDGESKSNTESSESKLQPKPEQTQETEENETVSKPQPVVTPVDDVKLKMTHATTSASRKNRPRAATGN